MNAFQRKGLISLRVPNGCIPFAAGTLKVKNYPLGLAATLRINKGIVSFLLVVGCYKNNIRRTVALKRDAPYGRGLILVSPFKDYFGSLHISASSPFAWFPRKKSISLAATAKFRPSQPVARKELITNNLSIERKKRAARVSRVDRGLRLNHRGAVRVAGTGRPLVVGPDLTDDPFGEGPALALRVADSRDVGADLEIR